MNELFKELLDKKKKKQEEFETIYTVEEREKEE